MAYTIKGLAKSYECSELNENGVADTWAYWYECNYGGRKDILKDFKSLRKVDRQAMLDHLKFCTFHKEVYNYIVSNLYV